MLNLFHLTLRRDLASPLSPWLWHLCPALSLALCPPSPLPPFSLSPCLIGTGLVSHWRCAQIQLVCVMLCCLVVLSNGRGGQESIWAHTHVLGRAHTAHTQASLAHYSFPSLPYCLSLRQNRARGVCAVVLPWSAIQVPWNSFHCDDQWHISISIKPENATGPKV